MTLEKWDETKQDQKKEDAVPTEFLKTFLVTLVLKNKWRYSDRPRNSPKLGFSSTTKKIYIVSCLLLPSNSRKLLLSGKNCKGEIFQVCVDSASQSSHYSFPFPTLSPFLSQGLILQNNWRSPDNNHHEPNQTCWSSRTRTRPELLVSLYSPACALPFYFNKRKTKPKSL